LFSLTESNMAITPKDKFINVKTLGRFLFIPFN